MKIIRRIPERVINIAVVLIGIINIIVWINLYEYCNSVNAFEFTALNIGQGDALLIKTPNNYYGLIDAGKGNSILEELSKTLPFAKRQLDFIIATHHDADHVEGLIEVLQRYDIKALFINKSTESKPLTKELLRIIKDQNIQTYSLNSTNDFEIDNVKFDVVWPISQRENSEKLVENDNSISMIISYKDLDIYSAGDLSTEYEIESVQTYEEIDIDILKASHHGSKTSSGIDFLTTIKPEFTIISVGMNNSYGHPNQEILENMLNINSKVFRTDINGRVKVKYEDGIEIVTDYSK
jgi:competence protein ComEC